MKTMPGRTTPFIRQWNRALGRHDFTRVVVLPAEPQCACCRHEVAA